MIYGFFSSKEIISEHIFSLFYKELYGMHTTVVRIRS